MEALLSKQNWHRNDYVRLTMFEPMRHHIYVVASDNPSLYDQHDPECWVIAVHDNDWSLIGSHVSTHYVEMNRPTLLYCEGN